MLLTIPWWSVILIYAICFIIVSFVFQAIDWAKIVKTEDRNFNVGFALYFIATLCATSLIGTLIITISSALAQIG